MALNIPTEGTKLNELKINIVDTQETFEAMRTANKVNANELYFIEQELPIIADSLKTGHTFKVNLASENASTAFNGTADITDIGVSGALPVKHGGTGFTTATYKNAVVIGNSSTVTNQLQTIRTASGAFYATGQDAKPSFGTLPIAQGGTGATSAANARTNLGLGTMATEAAANYLKLAGGTMTGGVTFVGNQSSAWNDKGILFTNGSRIGENSSKALGLYSASTFYIRPDSGTASSGKGLEISSAAMIPSVNNEMDLGSSDKKFKAIYATTLNGNLAWSNITSKPTTLSGYGITDAKINNGTITLGNNSITPLTSHQTVSNKGATLVWGSAITIATIGSTDIKVSLPANPDTDTKVTQNNVTAANDYRILLSTSANDTTETDTVNKNANLRYNPSTNTLSTGNISSAGNLTITGNTNLNGETYAESVTAGSLLVNGNTNFVQIPTAPTPATTSNDTSIATTAFVKNNLGGLSGAMHFKGTTTTALNDGTTTAAVTIGGNSYTPSAGDVVLYSDSEFVWTGSAWERLGRDSSFKVQQSAVTTATAETTTATTFVHSVTQDANGVITVKTRPLPTYNNYSLPLAADGTRGGIQIGYSESGKNYAVKLNNEKAYVNVPWTDTKVTQNAAITTDGSFPLLLSKSANTTAETDTVNKQGSLLYNPSTKVLTLSSADDTKGAIYINGQNHAFGLINGSGGTNYGIYDNTSGNTKWVLVDNETHNWRVKAAAERVDYLISPTAAGTAGKTVTAAQGGPHNFTLTNGTSIYVAFSNTNTVNNPTLAISGTTALPIYYRGVRIVYQGLANNTIYHLVYSYDDSRTTDKARWLVIGDVRTTTIGECTTAAATAAKTVTCPGFVLCTGATAQIIFTNQNSHDTPTLNINSTGAKALKLVGATTKNKYRFGGTDHVHTVIYDGTNYKILQEDFRHFYKRGISEVAATYYTQQEYDDYVAANGTEPSWAVGDQKTAAVAAVSGEERLTLGNEVTANTTNGLRGFIRLYGNGTNYTEIAAQGNGDRTFYLPNYAGTMYAAHTPDNNAVGSSNVPAYVAANGKLTVCLPYVTCSTAVGTVAKTATLTGFTLATGSKIVVNFTAGANTANSPTLNINSTGAKQIWHRNTQITSGANKALLYGACEFVYDGTRYHLIGNYYDTTTDTKVNVTLGTTTKAYLTGVSTTPTATAQSLTAIADTGVFLDTTAGQLAATSFRVVGSKNSSNTITSDATTNIYFNVNSKIPLCVTDTAIRSGSSVSGTIDLGSSTIPWNNVYANKFYGDGSNLTNLPTTYWANIATTNAASYNKAPEVATLKLNGNTSATAASTSNVTLVYNTTLQALNFVFV